MTKECVFSYSATGVSLLQHRLLAVDCEVFAALAEGGRVCVFSVANNTSTV